jgi:hypothetical protein
MSPETALALMTAIGMVAGGFQLWISAKVRGDILALKIWVMENFIHKDERLQSAQSSDRIKSLIERGRSNA